MRALLRVILVLGICLLSWKMFMKPVATERDMLVNDLRRDISRLVLEKELSQEDERIVRETLASFTGNPLLKTQREMVDHSRKAREQSLFVEDEGGRAFVKKMAERALVRVNKGKYPPPSVTSDLAHDFVRLGALKEIFIGAHQESQALDVLLRQVIIRIQMTTSA